MTSIRQPPVAQLVSLSSPVSQRGESDLNSAENTISRLITDTPHPGVKQTDRHLMMSSSDRRVSPGNNERVEWCLVC